MAIAYKVDENNRCTVPTVCINPNSMTVYNAIYGDRGEDVLATHHINFIDNFHDLQISASGARSLKKSVQIIAYLNKKRKIEEIAKKNLNRAVNKKWARLRKVHLKNFCLCTFATLTLPSEQMHTDVEIASQCINPLLSYLRKYYNLKYFVWKKELQANGNLHFHLILDCFVDHVQLRAEWNKILNKGKVRGIAQPFDYVDRYHDKRVKQYANGFQFQQTQRLRDAFDRECDKYLRKGPLSQENMDKIWADCQAYEEGLQRNAYNNEMAKDPLNRWRNPNSTDIKAVKKAAQVSYYIAKYIAKDMAANSPEILQYINDTNDYKKLIIEQITAITKECGIIQEYTKDAKGKKTKRPINLSPEQIELRHYCQKWQKNKNADRSALIQKYRDMFDELERLIEALRVYREKHCPLQGRLWFKSQSLSVFQKGCHLELDDQVTSELVILERELGTAQDGIQRVIRDNDRELITFICSVFQLAHYKRWFLLHCFDGWISECLQHNKERNL